MQPFPTYVLELSNGQKSFRATKEKMERPTPVKKEISLEWLISC